MVDAEGMNWSSILDPEEALEQRAHAAANLLDSSSFLADMDDHSHSEQQAQPQPDGLTDDGDVTVLERPEERAAGGAEPSAKRARFVFMENALLNVEFEDQKEDPEDEIRKEEREYAELQPVKSISPNATAFDLFEGMDYEGPSTSAASAAGAAAAAAAEEEPKKEEDEWVDFYYELEDPHADLIEKVRAQTAKSDAEIARIDAEFCAALIEKATVDQMIEQRKAAAANRRMYKDPTKDTKVFVCFVCSRGFLTTDEMRLHVEDAHLKPGAVRDFKCRYCRRCFARKQKLVAHEHKHEQPHASYACDKCPAFYNTEDSLERHYSDKHGCRMDGSAIGKRQLACDHCGKVFGIKKELQYHQYYCANKTQIAEKRAVKRASERVQLVGEEQEEAQLLDEPNFKIAKDKSCPICGLITASMQSRNRHIQRRHPEKMDEVLRAARVYSPSAAHLSSRPFQCRACEQAFANRAALSIHERRKHGANPAKMSYCGKCGRGFPLPSELRKHERRNEGVLMCRSRGWQGESTPSTPSSSYGGSRPETPADGQPYMRASTNMAINYNAGPNPDRKKAGKHAWAAFIGNHVKEEGLVPMEEVPEEDEGLVKEEEEDEEDETMIDGTMEEEIERDEKKKKKEGAKYDSLDDFNF